MATLHKPLGHCCTGILGISFGDCKFFMLWRSVSVALTYHDQTQSRVCINTARHVLPSTYYFQYTQCSCLHCSLPVSSPSLCMGADYGFMKGPLDSLCKMQRCACLWITGTFKPALLGLLKHSQVCPQSTFMLRSWWSGAMSVPTRYRPHLPQTCQWRP
jgi:hypothetical protein